MQIFSERIKELRLKKGLKQTDVSRVLSISVQSYSAYENGREPNYETLIKIAKLFDCSVDYLLGLEEFPNKEDENKLLTLEELFDLPEELGDCNDYLVKALPLFINLVNEALISKMGENLLKVLSNLEMFFYAIYISSGIKTKLNITETNFPMDKSTLLSGEISPTDSDEAKFTWATVTLPAASSYIMGQLHAIIEFHFSIHGNDKLGKKIGNVLSKAAKKKGRRFNGNDTET